MISNLILIGEGELDSLIPIAPFSAEPHPKT